MIKTTNLASSVFCIGVLLSTVCHASQVQAQAVLNASGSDRVSSHVSGKSLNSGLEAIASSSQPTTKGLTFNASSDDFSGEERSGNRTSGGSRGPDERLGDRLPGAARNPCLGQLIALVPGLEENSAVEESCTTPSPSLATQTINETPSFWFYLPALAELMAQPALEGTVPANPTAEFVLFDQNGDVLYTQSIDLTQTAETSGIVAVQPSYRLSLNQSYRWVFSIVVNTRNPSQNPTVEGWVHRVEPSPEWSHELAQSASASSRIAAYANRGIWQEALTELALLRRDNPDDAALLRDWRDLLSSVGLGAIADAPLLSLSATN